MAASNQVPAPTDNETGEKPHRAVLQFLPLMQEPSRPVRFWPLTTIAI